MTDASSPTRNSSRVRLSCPTSDSPSTPETPDTEAFDPALNDVVFTDDQGVMMPDVADVVRAEHLAVVESDYVTFNPETGEYAYELPIPPVVAARFGVDEQTPTPVRLDDTDTVVRTETGLCLNGTASNPGVVSFILSLAARDAPSNN